MSQRSKRASNNIISGVVRQTVSVFLPFINRTIVLRMLGAEYTGLSGLYSSIFDILNLAELGFNEAIIYFLYKPIANKDTENVNRLITLYRKIYYVIGSLILFFGLIISPFLNHIINGSVPENINIYILYYLMLIETVSSYYLFSYKQALFIADQRYDIIDTVRVVIRAIQFIGQAVILVITKNYYLYYMISLVAAIVINIIYENLSEKLYPEYRCIKGVKVNIPRDIIKRVESIFISKVASICKNTFDNIIISTFLGLTEVAIYGNYYYVLTSVYAFVRTVSRSITPSIGNSIAFENQYNNYIKYRKMTILFAWITAWCCTTMLCLYQPFIVIWVGEEFLFSNTTMVLFVIYFYTMSMTLVNNIFYNASGIWHRMTASYIVEAVANIVLNVAFGMYWGINGIILATIFTGIICWIWRTTTLYKYVFQGFKLQEYFMMNIIYALISQVVAVISWKCISLFPFKIGTGSDLLCRFLFCCIVPNILIGIMFYKLPYFPGAVEYIKLFIKK